MIAIRGQNYTPSLRNTLDLFHSSHATSQKSKYEHERYFSQAKNSCSYSHLECSSYRIQVFQTRKIKAKEKV